MVEVTRSWYRMLMGSNLVVVRRNLAHLSNKKSIIQVNQILRTSFKRVSTTVFMKSPLTFRMLKTIQIRIRLLRARRAHLIPWVPSHKNPLTRMWYQQSCDVIHRKNTSNLQYYLWKWSTRRKRKLNISMRSTQRLCSNRSSSCTSRSIDGTSGWRPSSLTWSKFTMKSSLNNNRVHKKDRLYRKSKSQNTSAWMLLKTQSQETLRVRHWVPLDLRTREALEFSTRFTIIWTDRIRKKKSSKRKSSVRSQDCSRAALLDNFQDRTFLRHITLWIRVRGTKSSSKSIKTIRN